MRKHADVDPIAIIVFLPDLGRQRQRPRIQKYFLIQTIVRFLLPRIRTVVNSQVNFFLHCNGLLPHQASRLHLWLLVWNNLIFAVWDDEATWNSPLNVDLEVHIRIRYNLELLFFARVEHDVCFVLRADQTPQLILHSLEVVLDGLDHLTAVSVLGGVLYAIFQFLNFFKFV